MKNIEKLEKLKKKRDDLKEKIASLQNKQREVERKQDTRRKIIVGDAVLTHAASDQKFEADLKALLELVVTKDSDRAAIQDLLE